MTSFFSRSHAPIPPQGNRSHDPIWDNPFCHPLTSSDKPFTPVKRLRPFPEFLLILGALSLLSGLIGANFQHVSVAAPAKAALADIEFQTLRLPSTTAYVVRVPKNSNFILFPSVAGHLDSVEKQVQGVKSSPYITPVASINAGFFDPKSGSNISYVVKNGEIIADPSNNPVLMNNNGLKPHINNILNRSEFRVLDCMSGLRYEIQRHNDSPPVGCSIRNSIQAGPKLLDGKAVTDEAFAAYDSAGKLTRDPIGFRYKNARSAIGIDQLGQPILVIVTQRPQAAADVPATPSTTITTTTTKTPVAPKPLKPPVPIEAPARPELAAVWNPSLDLDQIPASSGLSIAELGDLMKKLGAVKAMALDGGSSSSMWVTSKNFFGKVNKQRQPIQRRVKSVWIVGRKKS
jgi:Phosphodiester glycosidase